MLSSNKHKILFPAILIVFILGGFFVWQAGVAKAVEPAPANNLTPEQIQAAKDAGYSDSFINQTNTQPLNSQADPTKIQTQVASANGSNPPEWSMLLSPVFGIIGGVLLLILKLLNYLVSLGANLADAILSITSFTKVNVVTIGWGITRDLANMFFALILLIMSISTILQIDTFSYKAILRRLIIAALLINFSLMFAGIIIDFAQVMTSYFLTAGAGETGISANLTNGLKIVQIYNFSNVNQSVIGKIASVMWGTTFQMIVQEFMAIILMLVAAFSFFAMSFFLIARIVWIWLLLIFAPLAWISFIVPGAPGKLGSAWSSWWKEFLNWVFFAPIYSFFLYLALTVAKNGADLGAGSWQRGAAAEAGTAMQSEFFNSPATILQYIVIIMILLGGLKAAKDAGITGAATAMGWVESAGKWAGNKAKDYATRPGQWAYDSLANKATQKTGKAFSAIGFKKFGGRIAARGVQMETEPAERERHKNYAKLLGSMSDQDLQYEINKSLGIRKLLAVRQAKERGLLEKDPIRNFDDTDESNKFSKEAKEFKESSYLDKNDPAYLAAKEENGEYLAAKKEYEKDNDKLLGQSADTVKRALSVFSAYGLKDDKGKTKEEKELEEVRFDALPAKEQPTVIRRAKENGNLEKLKPTVLRNEQAMNSIIGELSPPEFTEVFKKWGKKTKKTAEDTMLKSFADLASLVDKTKISAEVSKRERFAAVTDKVGLAFSPPGMASLDPKNPMNKKYVETLANYVSTMTASKVSDIRHPDKEGDLKLVGQFAKPDLVSNFGREKSASAEQKGFFRAGAIDSQLTDTNEQAEAKKRLKGPGWSAFSNEEDDETPQPQQPKQYQPKGINNARSRNRGQQTA